VIVEIESIFHQSVGIYIYMVKHKKPNGTQLLCCFSWTSSACPLSYSFASPSNPYFLFYSLGISPYKKKIKTKLFFIFFIYIYINFMSPNF
jgi:prepilin signal peptidase PulO-like enzyme (type II secretory pathway)